MRRRTETRLLFVSESVVGHWEWSGSRVVSGKQEEILVTYIITETCIGSLDKSCVDVCPVDCIHFEEGVDRILYINPDECIDCGACEPACPVKAIYPEDAVPEDMEPFTVINVQWYQDPEAARARVNQLKPA